MLTLRRSLLCGVGLVSFVQHTASQTWDGPSLYPNGLAPDTVAGPGWDKSYPAFEAVNNKYPPPVPGTDGLNEPKEVSVGSSFGPLTVGNASSFSTLNSPEDEDASSFSSLDDEDAQSFGILAAKDFYLRILPLGASIVEGVASSDGNGFRKLLRQQLRWKGWKVNMVGTKNNGNMADNDNEGHPGWVIDQVHSEWSKTAVNGLKPNLVLVNAGTNDCNNNDATPMATAGNRLKSLIDDIYSKLPDVSIVVSTLVKSRDHRACAENLSQQYRDLVANSYGGKRIALADIDSVITLSQLSGDGIHPNDDGYRLFAAVWWDAISRLENTIQPPPTDGLIKDDSAVSSATCQKVAGSASGPIQTQKGSGHDDGNYVHNRVERGAIESARIQFNGDPTTITDAIPFNMYFANIIKGDPNADRSLALDDWIRLFVSLENKVTFYFRQNLGGGKFGPSTTFDPGMNCPFNSNLAFGDFNGDGLDDFFCIQDGASPKTMGPMSVSLNRGGSPPKFESIGVVVPGSSGWDNFNVRIADIDGDGRADFCLVGDDSVIKCSRNAGQGDKYSWQGFSTVDGIRGPVFNKGDFSSSDIQFGDINGDYRADVFLIGSNGNVQTWINHRGRGNGIVPEWVSAGLTHQGTPWPGSSGNVKFAKIYGSGRLDYIWLRKETSYWDVVAYENTGSGGTKLKADGTFYCDMRGTGSDDYVWIYADGHSSEIFANTHNPPFWDPNYTFTLTTGSPRTLIHLADWTGNGRCDVLVQNKETSAVTLFENQWNAGTKTLTFVNRGVVASPGCGKSTGVSIFDRNMRIADMDGDGRADIVCLELGGKLTGWLNGNGGMQNVGQIKLTEGWDRANLRLADVEGSGRADIIWLNKYTGAGSVWKNNGHYDGGGGSSFSWTKRGVLYSPIDRGEVMNFANLGGLGRADLIQVYPVTNEAYTFFNKCPGGGAGGDDGTLGDPGLPVYNGGSGGGSGGGCAPVNFCADGSLECDEDSSPCRGQCPATRRREVPLHPHIRHQRKDVLSADRKLDSHLPLKPLGKRVPTGSGGGKRNPYRSSCINQDTGVDNGLGYTNLEYPGIHDWTDDEIRYDFEFNVATQDSCSDGAIATYRAPTDGISDASYVTEHIVELQTLKLFIQSVYENKLPPNDASYGLRTIYCDFLKGAFDDQLNLRTPFLPVGVPDSTAGKASRSPIERILYAKGTEKNFKGFVFLEEQINGYKARLWKYNDPRAQDKADLENTDVTLSSKARKNIRLTINVFTYLNNPSVNGVMIRTLNEIREELVIANDASGKPSNDIAKYWDAWVPGHFAKMQNKARDFVNKNANDLRTFWTAQPPSTLRTQVLADCTTLQNQVNLIPVNLAGLTRV